MQTRLIMLFFTLILTFSQIYAEHNWLPDDLIKWKKGNGRIIIAAPHGGNVKVPNIPNRRRYGCLQRDGTCLWTLDCQPQNTKLCRSVIEADEGTLPIAVKVYHVLKSIGLSPHLIVNHMHRVKLDVNRPIEEAAQGNEFAEAVYKCFHDSIREAQKMIHGPGLYLDIHGQSHMENWTEIGYKIPQIDLVYGNFSVFNSSIKALAERSKIVDPKALIIGPESFGSILESRRFGYKVTPSFRIPQPHLSAIHNYYDGGYDTLHYGSLNGGLIDAIQVEIAADIRLKSPIIIEQFAIDLAISISSFMNMHNYFD